MSCRACAIWGAESFGFLPNFTPRRCAAFTPARVRSVISERSSSASTPIICHMARPVAVSVSIASVSERNCTPPLLQVIEHVDEIPQTPTQPVELPDDERVARLQRLQALDEGRALRRRPGDPLVLEHGPATGLLQGGELQGRILILGRDARVAVFHAGYCAEDGLTSRPCGRPNSS